MFRIIHFTLFMFNFQFIFTVGNLNSNGDIKLDEGHMSDSMNLKRIDNVRLRIFRTFFRKMAAKIEKDLWELWKKLDIILDVLVTLNETNNIAYKKKTDQLKKPDLKEHSKIESSVKNKSEYINQNYIHKGEWNADIDDKMPYDDETSPRAIFILKMWQDNKLVEFDYDQVTCNLIHSYKNFLSNSIKDKIKHINSFIIPGLVIMYNKAISVAKANSIEEQMDGYKRSVEMEQEKLELCSRIDIREVKRNIDERVIARRNRYPNEELRHEEYSDMIIGAVNYFINKLKNEQALRNTMCEIVN